MKKSIKGAIATGGAAVILLGGAGSLAYWTDTGNINAGTIESGNLKIDATSCDASNWTVTNTVEKVTSAPFNITTQRIVPGDVLTKTCTVGIIAVGTNLRAKLGTTGGTTTGSTMASTAYTVTPTFKLNGADINTITAADTGKSVTATITVDFPIKTTIDNDSKLKNIAITNYTITATQALTPVTP